MKNKQPQSETMFQTETLPQSMVDLETIVLKPRLDKGDVELIGEKIKPRLFSKFILKTRLENTRLICSELYFEPYLIIGGKYALDYCKKHVFRVNVDERTKAVFVAGQEFKSEQSGPKAKTKIIRMPGEEYAHYERQAYFILDRMKREISPDTLPISPFCIQKEKDICGSNFKSINIPDEAQIEFLKAKIAIRPRDLAAVIKEIFDITDRKIAYYPIYELTFEHTKSLKVAKISVNGITGEIILNGTQKIATKTIVEFPKTNDSRFVEMNTWQIGKPKTENDFTLSEPLEDVNISPESLHSDQLIEPVFKESNILGFPARINGEIFVESEDVIAIVGNVEVPPNTTINKTLTVKGSLKIGDNCIARGKLKALKDITIGDNSLVVGDVVSEGDVTVGPQSVITGFLQAKGSVKIYGEAKIESLMRSNPEVEVSSDVQFQVNTENLNY